MNLVYFNLIDFISQFGAKRPLSEIVNSTFQLRFVIIIVIVIVIVGFEKSSSQFIIIIIITITILLPKLELAFI